MRKAWRMVPVAAAATVALQFAGVGVSHSQVTDGLVGGTGGLVGGTGGMVGGTTGTTGTTGGAVATPIIAQPRFTG